MGVWRGYWKPIPFANVYIYAISIAFLLYSYRSKGDKKDSIFKIIEFVVSSYENPSNEIKNLSSVPCSSGPMPTIKQTKKNLKKTTPFNIIWKSLRVYQYVIRWIKTFSRHSTCPHPHSCMHFFLEGTTKLFVIGLGVQLAIKSVFRLPSFIKEPNLLKSIVFKKENLNLALFFGGFSGLYRLTVCFLRRIFDRDSKYHAIPGGLVASISFVAFSNNTVALYVMWKALQLLWNSGVEKGYLPENNWFVIILYSLSTAVLFHAAVVEPQNLRSSYWKFLYNLSGGRIASMSRIPLDKFGLSSSENLKNVLEATKTTNLKTYSF